MTFACCFLFSKLNLTLVAFFSLILKYRASVDMTVAVAISDPLVHLARKKGESEKRRGWRLFTLLLMVAIGLCKKGSFVTEVLIG